MNTISFKVFSLCKEIGLNKIATHFGINKNFNWVDFLSLEEDHLKGIVKEPAGKMVNVFPFGSVVFINLQHHEIVDIVNYLKKIEKNLDSPSYDFTDDYKLEITDDEEIINYDSMLVKNFDEYHTDILSIVLAKSVALEKVENDTENILDEIESVILLLKEGKLNSRDEKLAKTSARILSFKYNMISYIMLLDKPDITWDNQAAEELYIKLSHLFELNDRYDKIQAKSETLMDIVQVFTSLTHQKRGDKLEWMVIILIGIEIVLTLIDFFFFKL